MIPFTAYWFGDIFQTFKMSKHTFRLIKHSQCARWKNSQANSDLPELLYFWGGVLCSFIAFFILFCLYKLGNDPFSGIWYYSLQEFLRWFNDHLIDVIVDIYNKKVCDFILKWSFGTFEEKAYYAFRFFFSGRVPSKRKVLFFFITLFLKLLRLSIKYYICSFFYEMRKRR